MRSGHCQELLLAVLLLAGCQKPASTPPVAKPTPPAKVSHSIKLPAVVQNSPILWADVTGTSGIDFTYFGSPSPDHYMTEQNGGGVGLFDYDADGTLDVFLANGSHFLHSAENAGATHALYRGRGAFQFQNLSQEAGVAVCDFGMGCATGDVDNDGFVDLLLTGYGRNRLWHNQGDGTLVEEVLPASPKNRWSTSAALADFDDDGQLDIYLANYVDYSSTDARCFTQHQPPIHISCGPIGRTAQPDTLLQNLGDGTFADVSQAAGIAVQTGKGLGVTVADYNGDQKLDIYVANDTDDNLLFINQGGMRFVESGVREGVAVGADGVARSGMGCSSADYNGDGRFDLVVTNFQNEPDDLYANLGVRGFTPTNTQAGLDTVTRPTLGFGVAFTDFDLDGRPDLFLANGHVWDLTPAGLHYEYAMRPQMFHNTDGHKFTDGSATAGDYFQRNWLGRAAAVGDLDNDGDPDLVVTHLREPVAVLRNDSKRSSSRVMSLELIGARAARQPRGTQIDMRLGDHRVTLRVPAGDSFQSSHDHRVQIAAGNAVLIDEISVTWGSGRRQRWQNVPVVPTLQLVEQE